MASRVSRKGYVLAKGKSIKEIEERRRGRIIGYINMNVEITSDDEFRRGSGKVFK